MTLGLIRFYFEYFNCFFLPYFNQFSLSQSFRLLRNHNWNPTATMLFCRNILYNWIIYWFSRLMLVTQLTTFTSARNFSIAANLVKNWKFIYIFWTFRATVEKFIKKNCGFADVLISLRHFHNFPVSTQFLLKNML